MADLYGGNLLMTEHTRGKIFSESECLFDGEIVLLLSDGEKRNWSCSIGMSSHWNPPVLPGAALSLLLEDGREGTIYLSRRVTNSSGTYAHFSGVGWPIKN